MNLSMEIRYGTKLHDKIRDMVRSRVMLSRRKLATEYERWAAAEDLYTAYVPTTEEDSERSADRSAGAPEYTTITVPYSLATLLTAHTYWASVFLSRTPIFQYTARHGEGQQQVQAIEALIDYQVHVGGMLVPLYGWLLDAGKYGIGIVGNYWTEEVSTVSSIEMVPKNFMGMPIPGTERPQRVRRTVTGYVGNKLYNVMPQDIYPDPRVSLTHIQDGEYFGRQVSIGWNTVVRRAAAGTYFNIERLQRAGPHGQQFTPEVGHDTELPDRGSFQATMSQPLSDPTQDHPYIVDAVEMVIELIPSEVGLGASSYPEKWVFTVAFNEVVIGAQPLGADHNKFPFFVSTYDFDPYGYSRRGILELAQPLNEVLDWLFNSHMFNVRKALNDELVYDPSRIVGKDLRDGGPGRMIRLHPRAYGTNVQSAIMQLPVMDVTGQNLRVLQTVMEMIQRTTGVTDNLMGVVYPGGRKTATEVRTSSSFGINRLKTIAEFNSALGWEPLSQVLVQNSQQWYDGEMKLRIVRDLAMSDPEFIVVRPEDITGFYDFVPVDGTLPIDRFAQANLWKEVLLGLGQMPQIAAQYDIAGIFSWMAQLAGLKNITQFRIRTMPDEQVMQQAQAGNLRPVPKGAQSGGNPTGVAPEAATGPQAVPGAIA